jgi:hypothetical protein
VLLVFGIASLDEDQKGWSFSIDWTSTIRLRVGAIALWG